MNLNTSIAVLSVRLVLGLIFFMQGFGKVFTWGVESLYKMDFFYETYKDLLPDWLTYATAYYTSYVELLGGLLLILGLKTDIGLYALISLLVIITFGHGLATPIWDITHVVFRLILVIALLLAPKNWDVFSLDHLIAKYRAKK